MKRLQEIFIIIFAISFGVSADVTSYSVAPSSMTPVAARLLRETQAHVFRIQKKMESLQARFFHRPLLFFWGTYLDGELALEHASLHDRSKLDRSRSFRDRYYAPVGLDPKGPSVIELLSLYYGINKKDMSPEMRESFDWLLAALNAIDWQIQVEFFAEKGFLKPAAVDLFSKTGNAALIQRNPQHLNHVALDLLNMENAADKVDRQLHSQNEIGMKPDLAVAYLSNKDEVQMANYLINKEKENKAGKSLADHLNCRSLFPQRMHLIFGNSYESK